MLCVTWLRCRCKVLFALAMLHMFTMRGSTGCILMKPLNIMCVLDIGFHKFPPLRNTLVLVPVRSRCMVITLLDSGCNVVGNQLHQCI